MPPKTVKKKVKSKAKCLENVAESTLEDLKEKKKIKNKKKKKKKALKKLANAKECAEENKKKVDFTVSSAFKDAEWESDCQSPDNTGTLPTVDLSNAIFLPYPSRKILGYVGPYPRDELEEARAQLIKGLQCNSPVLSRVKLKCGILADGRRFGIPRPPFHSQRGAPGAAAAGFQARGLLGSAGRGWQGGGPAPHTVTSWRAQTRPPLLPCPPTPWGQMLGAGLSRGFHPFSPESGSGSSARWMLWEDPQGPSSGQMSGPPRGSQAGGPGDVAWENRGSRDVSGVCEAPSSSAIPGLREFPVGGESSRGAEGLQEETALSGSAEGAPVCVTARQADPSSSFKFPFSSKEFGSKDCSTQSGPGSSSKKFTFNFALDGISASSSNSASSLSQVEAFSLQGSVEMTEEAGKDAAE